MTPPLLDVRGLCKSFGPTRALNDVDLRLDAGEVVAVLGENGAGKSTLMKALAGVFSPDAGDMAFRGEPYAPATPADAVEAGIATVFQEPTFFPQLSVLENIFAGRQPRGRLGSVRWGQMEGEGQALFADLGLPASLLPRRMEQLSLGNQQLVLIARALHLDAKVLILDEPTSILTDSEAATLFGLVRRLTGSGGGVLYITHRVGELSTVADRLIVLKDGHLVCEAAVAEVGEQELIHLMSGRHIESVEALADRRHRADGAPALLDVAGLTADGHYSDVSFSVGRGQIVGLYGLVGAGRTEIALSLFGMLPPTAGQVTLDGAGYAPRSPRDAMAAGVGYLPEDRKSLGLFPLMDTGSNLSSAALPRLSGRGFVRRDAERALVTRSIQSLGVKVRGPSESILNLSGGSQQKVLLARWLATEPRLLILDEPTRGIDVSTKAEIHRLIFELAGDGLAVLLISSELPELLALSDHVHVLREGRVTANLPRGEASGRTVMEATMGYVAGHGTAGG